MRTNKISNVDLFTQNANEYFKKHIKTQSKQALETIDQLVDWNTVIQPLEHSISRFERGRRPFSLLVIVKCFILQTIYNLSDPRLEEEIADRRSFQIFLGLSSGDAIPDETTICRYRELFAREKLDRRLFRAFNDQLKNAGLILEKGTIIDASIKQSYTKPSAQSRDKDATFLKRGKKTFFGYKAHIGMDAKTQVIHSTEFTPANVHDSEMFDHLLTGKETAVLADKGYANEKRKSRLRQEGIFCGVLDKSYRSRPLSGKQKKRNKKLSAVRNAVERPFAFMRHVLEYGKCRYYSLGRNRFQFHLTAVIYNLRRWITLETCPA
jgi:IS5 family transposase